MVLRVEQVLQRRREAQVGLLVEVAVLVAQRAGTDVDAGFVRMLEVGVLEVELAVRVVLAVTVQVTRLDGGLPRGRAAVVAAATGQLVARRLAYGGGREWRHAGWRIAAQQVAGLAVLPGRIRGLDQHRGVQADLLEGGRTVVVVGEDDAQAAIHVLSVQQRVGKPALQRDARALPVDGTGALGGEVRVLLGVQGGASTGAREGAEVAVGYNTVEAVDGVDAFAHGTGGQGAVFVVPAVGGTVGRGQVPLGQVDVLTDDVGRRAQLVVIHLERFRHEIGVVVHRAVEGVHPHHQRLTRLVLLDHRQRVFPQGDDALLRVVVAHLVDHRVVLDVGTLVDARRVGAELTRGDRHQRTGEAGAVPLVGAVGGHRSTGVVLARVAEDSARNRGTCVDAEIRGLHRAIGQHGVGSDIAKRVEDHGGALDVGATLGVEHRLGLGHDLGQVDRAHDTGDGGRGLAAGGDAVQRMARQTAVHLGVVTGQVDEVGLHRGRVALEGLLAGHRVDQGKRLGLGDHVQRRRRRTLADDAFFAGGAIFAGDAGDPERVAGVHVIGGAEYAVRALDGRVVELGLAGRTAGGGAIAVNGHHGHASGGHRGQALAGQRHDGGDGGAHRDFTVGQRARAGGGGAVLERERYAVEAVAGDRQLGAGLERVMDAPHVPHALREVRVEVAVIDGVASRLVAVAGSAVGDLVGVAHAGADALGVEVVRVVVVRVVQPLVVVQVEDVLLEAVVGVAELDEVADVAVVDIRRVTRVVGLGGLGAHGGDELRLGRGQRRRTVLQKQQDIQHVLRRDGLQAGVGREVHQVGHFAHREVGEEEFLVGAVQAVVHGADAQTVGQDLGADAARTVVDHELVAHTLEQVGEDRGQRVDGLARRRLEAGDVVKARIGLRVGRLVVPELREVAERLQAVRVGRVAHALAFQRVGAGGEGAVGVGADDHGVHLGVHDGVALDHGQDGAAALAFSGPGQGVRVGGLVVEDRLPAQRGAVLQRGRARHGSTELGAGGAGARRVARGQPHLFFGHRIAVGLGARGFDDELAEQTVGGVALVGVRPHQRAVADDLVDLLALGVQVVG